MSDCFLYLEIFASFIGATNFVEHWLYLPHSKKKTEKMDFAQLCRLLIKEQPYFIPCCGPSLKEHSWGWAG